MTDLKQYEIPLYLFFEQLQKNKFALDITAYNQLLKALQGGLGMQNRSDLQQLCTTLWYKPHHDFELFNTLFETYFEEEKQLAIQLIQSEEVILTNSNQRKQEGSTKEEELDKTPSNTPFELKDEDKQDIIEEENNTSKSVEETEYTTIQLSIGHQASDKILEVESSKSPYDYHFHFNSDALPFSQRKLLLEWRTIQATKRNSHYKKLDISASIDAIPKQGKYLQPIFTNTQKQPKPTYLLIDKGGSMVAYDTMVMQFSQLIKRHFSTTEIYYFYNTPQEYLFQNITYTEGIRLSEFYKKCKTQQPNIIIFSDAGAARGRYNSERIQESKQFLKKIQRSNSTAVWFNPMPQKRWKYNSASAIATYTHMFELNLSAMQEAIQFIKHHQ